ncbi:hypothetical protein [Ruania rhizosphaerae]|uniref:hypothetical protein n=1 Tax=Ruania rhizosphaerae TaxID=1840413 RepID=UPI00135B5A47|nr:hypothetical protein [Ruania rhizosphaerae]
MNTKTTKKQQDETDRQLRIEQLVLEHAKTDADIKALTDRKAELKALIADELDEGKHPFGEYDAVVTCPMRLDTAALAKDYPITQHPNLYKASLDTAEVKKRFAPAALDEYRSPGAKVVTIREAGQR